MIIVHDIFVCKPGNASKMAKMFKEWVELEKTRGFDSTVMTDMTGQFHRVIIATKHESLTTYDKDKDTMGDSPEHKELMKKFADMNEMYVTGSREIYKVW